MSSERVFTDAELKEMGAKTRDLIDEYIDKGDLEKAKRLNHRMYAEWQSMHDLYRDWVTSLLSYIYETYGMQALTEALHRSCTAWFRPIYERIEQADSFRRKVEMFAMGLRGHLQPIDVEEDDEKVCLTMRPCGSGGRLIREGAYGPPKNFSKVRDACPLTFGQTDFPIYCTHTPMLEMLQIEWKGQPRIVCEVPDDIKKGDCTFCVYKDTNAVPEKFYKRVGKEKKR